MYSRRKFFTTAALSLPFVAQSSVSAKSAPAGRPLLKTQDLIRVQAFAPLPSFKNLEELSKFLEERFVARARSRNANVAPDAQKTINGIIKESMPKVFTEDKLGSVDKTKQYQNLPIPVRQVITIRNLDTMSDIAIVLADRENKKSQKGVIITASIIQSVRDFVCPMFPFCTA